jgi:hypothetical protein
MLRPFTNYSAKSAFKQVNEPLEAGEYIRMQKTKYTFCKSNKCHANKCVLLSRQPNRAYMLQSGFYIKNI